MLTANQVASVIIARNEKPWTDALSLQKLLYYTQSWHLAITGEPLFPERFQAYAKGPVVPQVRHLRMDMETRRAADQDLSNVELDELASNLIDLVIARFGSMEAEELSALTHTERPWVDARGDLPEGAKCSEIISNESMASFYRSTHRSLAGRTAADLAAGGIVVRDPQITEAVDVDAILADLDLDVDSLDTSPWSGANLTPAVTSSRPRRPQRASR